jgi:hypothetical protein
MEKIEIQKLPKDILIKLLTTIQEPKEMNEKDLNKNIINCIQERLNRNLKKIKEEIKDLNDFPKLNITSIRIINFESSLYILIGFSNNIIVTFKKINKKITNLSVKENGVIKYEGGDFTDYIENRIKDENFKIYDEFTKELNYKGYIDKLTKFM